MFGGQEQLPNAARGYLTPGLTRQANRDAADQDVGHELLVRRRDREAESGLGYDHTGKGWSHIENYGHGQALHRESKGYEAGYGDHHFDLYGEQRDPRGSDPNHERNPDIQLIPSPSQSIDGEALRSRSSIYKTLQRCLHREQQRNDDIPR